MHYFLILNCKFNMSTTYILNYIYLVCTNIKICVYRITNYLVIEKTIYFSKVGFNLFLKNNNKIIFYK